MQLGSLSFVPSNLLATILNSEVPELNSIARLTVTFGAFLCLLFEISTDKSLMKRCLQKPTQIDIHTLALEAAYMIHAQGQLLTYEQRNSLLDDLTRKIAHTPFSIRSSPPSKLKTKIEFPWKA